MDKLTPFQQKVPTENIEHSTSESDSDEEHWEDIKKRRLIARRTHLEQIGSLKMHSATAKIFKKLAPKRKMVRKEMKSKALPPLQRRSIRLSKTEEELQAAVELMQQREVNPYHKVTYKMVPAEEHTMLPLDIEGNPTEQVTKLMTRSGYVHDDSLDSFIKNTKKAVSKGCIDKKMARKQIMTLALSGNSNEKLIAVGDAHGSLGIWNFDQRKTRKTDGDSVYQFTANAASLRCIRFSPRDNSQLYMAGYNGRFRVANLERLIFETSLIDDESRPLACFDFQDASGNMVICGGFNGDIIMKDVRSCKATNVYDVHDCVVKSVSFHPLKPQYFATASNDAQIKVWDARKLSESGKVKPITVASHANTVNSAFFSQVTGNKLLSTSLDNTIRLFDTSKMEEGILRCLKTADYDVDVPYNTLSLQITDFQATWHPKREDLFFIGSMKQPRRIDLYDAQKMEIAYVYQHKNLTTVCSVIRHHPTLNFIVGSDYYGRVHIFDE